MLKNFIPVIAALTLLSSCSVAMAAKKSGHSLSEVQTVRTRPQMLNLASQVLTTEKNSSGELIETYQIEKKRGSGARAVMHGVLDLSTGCLWEIVGTPMEASMSKKETFVVKVVYAANSDRVERIELQ